MTAMPISPVMTVVGVRCEERKIDTAGQSLTVSATVVTATATTNQNDTGCPESLMFRRP